jgi:hypothetical protein
MAFRKLRDADVKNKTLKGVENNAANTVILYFTDGTSLELWAENEIVTQFGSIPGIFVDDVTVKCA